MKNMYKRKSGIIMKELGSDTMLYCPNSEAVHVPNKTSAFVWRLLERPAAVPEIEKAIGLEFKIPEGVNVHWIYIVYTEIAQDVKISGGLTRLRLSSEHPHRHPN